VQNVPTDRSNTTALVVGEAAGCHNTLLQPYYHLINDYSGQAKSVTASREHKNWNRN